MNTCGTKYAWLIAGVTVLGLNTLACVNDFEDHATAPSEGFVFDENYRFIHLSSNGTYTALSGDESSSNGELESRTGTWSKIKPRHLQLKDDASHGVDTLTTVAAADLGKIYNRTLTTARQPRVSDRGDLNYRSITLNDDHSFKATSSNGRPINGTYAIGLIPAYVSDASGDTVVHRLDNAILFTDSTTKGQNSMAFSLSSSGALTLNDPNASGNYPVYK